MNPMVTAISNKTILRIGYLYVFLILIDAPLVILYSFTGSVLLAKILLYASEAIILVAFGYLLLHSSQVGLPRFVYLFIVYIFLMTLIGFIFYDVYGVARDARRYIALLPPLLVGYYFVRAFGHEREKFVKKIIIFLTVMSAISLIEWILFYVSYDFMMQLYSHFFRAGDYYRYVKEHPVPLTETGLARSGMTQSNIFIPGFDKFKRATGVYIEGYSAGINAAAAIILILYSKIAGYRIIKRMNIFVAINLLAVILATSRSAYIFLFVSLFVYSLVRHRPWATIFLCLLPFLYTPFTHWCINSIKGLGGAIHREAIVTLPGYLFNNIFSFDKFVGMGMGASREYVDGGAIKEITIQLGFIALFIFFLLHFAIMTRIPPTRENRFVVLTAAIGIFLLSIYSGRIFGYKSLGMVYFFLGYISWTPLKKTQTLRLHYGQAKW